MPEQLFWLLPCHQNSTKDFQTCEGLHQPWALPWHFGYLFFFFFWMLRHPVFWYTTFFLTQSVRSPLVTYPSLCSPCVTYRMWCHASSHQVLPTEPSPRETEDSPWCGNHSKHVSLLTCLAWLQPIYYNPKFVFMHVKTGKVLLVVKTSIKNM